MNRERELLRLLDELFEECESDNTITPTYSFWRDRIRALLDEPQSELQANSKPEQNLESEPHGEPVVLHDCPKCGHLADCPDEPQGEQEWAYRVPLQGDVPIKWWNSLKRAQRYADDNKVNIIERAQVGEWEAVDG